ncbi:MAG: anti-sigma factor domain-containing protein [Clostridiaceae bacterium]|nr:anti-sigma factor domain-containing protein [Clostridiaceae bacterium]
MDNFGIVYEVLKNDVIVLTPEGQFMTLKKKDGDISEGMLIEFDFSDICDTRKSFINGVLLISGIAAIIVFAFVYFKPIYTNIINSTSFCYIDVDINPGIGFVIDDKGNISSTTRLTDDAKNLMKQFKIEGQPVWDTIELLSERCLTNGVINKEGQNNILISVSLNKNVEKDSDEEKRMNEILVQIHNKIRELGINNDISINPVIVKVDPEERKAAKENNISMGRYRLYLKVLEKDAGIKLEEIKDISIADLLKILEENMVDTGSEITISDPDTASESNKGLKIQYYCLDKQIDTQGINYSFTILNTGDHSVDLKDTKVRYYFKEEEDKLLRFEIYYFGDGKTEDVHGKFFDIPDGQKANKYLEITFSKGAVSPGETLHVRGIFYRDDWSRFNQGDDYSYNPVDETYVDWDKITIYVSDKLVWGVEP